MSENGIKHWYSKIVNDKLVRTYIKDKDMLRAFPCAELVGMQGRIQMADILFNLPVAGYGPKWEGEGE